VLGHRSTRSGADKELSRVRVPGAGHSEGAVHIDEVEVEDGLEPGVRVEGERYARRHDPPEAATAAKEPFLKAGGICPIQSGIDIRAGSARFDEPSLARELIRARR